MSNRLNYNSDEDEYRAWLKDSVKMYTLKCLQHSYNNNN